MSITLKTTKNHVLRETTVTAQDAKGAFLCAETLSGTGARVAAQLATQVRAAAERIQRAEQARPRYHIIDVPGMAVQSLAFPTHA